MRSILAFLALLVLAGLSFSQVAPGTISSCQLINASGTYNLTQDLSTDANGGPISWGPGWGACIVINGTSDVTLDCQGHTINISNSISPTGFSSGIVAQSSVNVTVKNCRFIQDGGFYFAGIDFYGANDSFAINNTATATNNMLAEEFGTNNQIINNTAINTSYGFLSGGVSSLYMGNNASGVANAAFCFDEIFCGIALAAAQGDTLVDNNVTNSGNGFQMLGGGGHNITNNSVTGGTGYGFWIRADGNILNDNFAGSNANHGFLIQNSISNSLDSDLATLNGGDGFFIDDSQNLGSFNNITNSNATNNSMNGFELTASDNDVLSNNIAANNSQQGFILDAGGFPTPVGCTLINLTGNLAESNGASGFYLDTANDSILLDNNATSNGQNGVYLINSFNNTITGGLACDSVNDGFELDSSNTGNSITGSFACRNGEFGFNFMTTSDNNTISDSSSVNNSISGLQFSSDGVNATGVNATGNGDAGFYVFGGTNTMISGGLASGNARGFYVYLFSDNTTIDSALSFGNIGEGLNIFQGNNTILSNSRFYNNNPDFDTANQFGGPFVVNFTGVVFDNPAGSIQNFTTVSLNDTVQPGDEYSMNWSAPPAPALPTGPYTSFAGKYLNITPVAGTPSLDSIAFTWSPSELSGYSESRFQLWKSSGGVWSAIDTNPDTANHQLLEANLDPASVYAIIQSDACPPTILTPGTTLTLNSSIIGATNPFPAGLACINVEASNVTVDCQGNSVTNNGTDGSYGVAISSGAANVTVKNCLVSQYSGGVILLDSSGNTIQNVTSFNNTLSGGSTGFMLTGQTSGSHNNTFTGDTAFGNNLSGFHVIFGSSGNAFTNDSSYGNGQYGFVSGNGTGNSFSSDNATGNGAAGFWVVSGASGVFSGNTVDNNPTGFLVQTFTNPATLNTISGNTLTNNTRGIYFNSASGGNNVSGNSMTLGTSGILVSSSPSNTFSGNSVTAYQNGISVQSSDGTNVTSNNVSAYGGSFGEGIGVSTSGGFLVSGNIVHDYNGTGSDAIGAHGTTSGLFSSNTAYNSNDGFSIDSGASGTSFESNIVHDITFYCFIVANSGNNTLGGNTAYHCGDFGYYVFFGSGNLFENDTAYNSSTGFFSSGSGSNTFNNDTAYFSGFAGFDAVDTSSTVYSNDVSHDNPLGFNLRSNTTGNSITLSTAYNNSVGGVLLDGANQTTLSGLHLYGNSPDFSVTGDSTLYQMSGTVFDNPAGDFTSFTNLSVNDTLASGDSYEMAWTPQIAPPAGFFSFAGKFVSITTMNGSPSIDHAVWSWQESELSGYNKTRFELWKNDGVWVVQNDTPDTVSDTLSLTSFSPLSTYAILQNNLTTNISAIKLLQTAVQPSQGGMVEFNVTVNNSGNLSLDPVTVVDVLPAGLTYSSASPVPDSVAGQTLTWNNLGPLGGGNSTVIYINATVDPVVVNQTNQTAVLTNAANATGTDKYGDNVTASSSANVTVYFAAISLMKVDITPVLTSPGGAVQWQINVSNPGQVTLEPASVEDVLPAGFQYAGASPAADSVSPDNRTMVWNDVGPIAAGGSSIILLNSSVGANVANGTYTNSVNTTGVPPDGTSVTASATAQVGIFAPAISVVKSVENMSAAGQNTTWTINVTNTGSINLTVSAVDTLPANMSFVGASIAPTSVSNQTVTWTNFTVLPPGASFVILMNTTTNLGGVYLNNVSVTGVPPNGNSVTANTSASSIQTTPGPSGGHETLLTLSAGFQSNCTGNTITVTSGGAISGATVVVNGNTVGSTDSNGQLSFAGCGQSLIVRASKSGYLDAILYPTEIACGQCAPVTCVNDTGCALDQRCQVNAANASLNQCVPLQCGCGQTADDHQCVGTVWQCGSGPSCNSCPSGQACNADHVCQPTGCTSDQQCKDNEACITAAGAPGTAAAPGSCQNVTGACGYVSNHAFVPYNYTCGTEPGCPSCPAGQSCVAHQCVQYGLDCPAGGVVGSSVTCKATANGQACPDCNYTVTDPSGASTSGQTGPDGSITLPLNSAGQYRVSIMSAGAPVNSAQVAATAGGQPSQPSAPPAATGPDLLSVLWLLLLLLIVIAAVIYWRSRSQKK